ncbi:hypothetical protein BYT27DRAFT_6898129 [Phlegmacium glaucopus]|nr:hypothetical protein BYT27DRAFT_6898129 [Phlegmacium glaucopus]
MEGKFYCEAKTILDPGATRISLLGKNVIQSQIFVLTFINVIVLSLNFKEAQ